MGERVRHRKYTKEILTEAVGESTSMAGVMRHLGLRPAGGTHAHLRRVISSFGIDTSHFRPSSVGGKRRLLPAWQILTRLEPGCLRTKPHLLKRALLEIGRDYRCTKCGNDGFWMGQPLNLEIDHIDGDFYNNLAHNLRFLCPNCHRQTPNFAGKSRGKFADPPGVQTAAGNP